LHNLANAGIISYEVEHVHDHEVCAEADAKQETFFYGDA
jgi:hypothetical protein